jgi:hypothetical protein
MADQICGKRKSGLAWRASPEEDSKMLVFTHTSQARLPFDHATSECDGRRLVPTKTFRRKHSFAGLLLAVTRRGIAAEDAIRNQLAVGVARAACADVVAGFEVRKRRRLPVAIEFGAGGGVDRLRRAIAGFDGQRARRRVNRLQFTEDAIETAFTRSSARRRLVSAPHLVGNELAVRIARPVGENKIAHFEIRKRCGLAVALDLGVRSNIDYGCTVIASLHGD